MLPGITGFETCRRLREAGVWAPVLMLTARDAVEDRVAGLDTGADDYLVKPVSIDELAARLRAVTRRAAGQAEPVWRHGPLEFHPASRQATWNGEPIELTSREALLLELLLAHPNRVLTRDFLRDKLYAWDKSAESNTLEVHIHHLRRKLHPAIVRTLRGAGYSLGSLEAIGADA